MMSDDVMESARSRGASAAEWSIGVDFGTAFSKAAATRLTFAHGSALREVTPLRIGEAAGATSPFLAPSCVFLDRKRVYFSQRATERIREIEEPGRELLRSFKMVLGAHDFEHALEYLPPVAVDPDGVFRRRDLLVLYLAHLLSLVDSAATQRMTASQAASAPVRLRYSRPGWVPDRIAAAHETMSSLFVQANRVRQLLGADMMREDGVEYQRAHDALAAARATPGEFPALDGGVYEASAVGVCHFSDPTAPNFLVIVDIGAGTTDVAGLHRSPYSGEIRVIREARRTVDIAGDSFDTALLHFILKQASHLKSGQDKSALWRSLLPHVRDLKEELFTNGILSIEFRRVPIRIAARDFIKQPHFKQAFGEIAKLYYASLKAVVEVGKGQGSRTIGVVLSGGASKLPAFAQMVKNKPFLGPGVRVVRLPNSPSWTNELKSVREWESLFGQLCVAFGAAISDPENMRRAAM